MVCNVMFNGSKHMHCSILFRTRGCAAVLASLVACASASAVMAEEPPAPAATTAPAAEPAPPAEPAKLTAEPAKLTSPVVTEPIAVAPAPTATEAAAPVAGVAVEGEKKSEKPSRWAGTGIILRQMTGVTSFIKSTDPTWNPNEVLALMLTPRFALTEDGRLYVKGWQYANIELSNSDSTTKKNEGQLSDTILSLGYSVYKNKEVGLTVNVEGQFTIPTSKSSLAKTMRLGTGIGVSAGFSKGPFSVGVTGRGTHYFYESQNPVMDKPWLDNCVGLATGCDPFQISGSRNSEWRYMAIGSIGYEPTSWLSFSVAGGQIGDFPFAQPSSTVYLAGEKNGAATTIAADPNATNFRALMYYGLGAEFRVHPALGIGVGAETYNAQLKPDSTYESPFLNRYSTIYLELNLSPDKLPRFW